MFRPTCLLPIIMVIFKQDDFSGGLNTQVDAAKGADNVYPLLVNGRTRRNVITPTRKHVQLNAPAGIYQGLYTAGSHLVLFISGVAYYANITDNPILFFKIGNWTEMDTEASRLYAEIVPANANFFNRSGTPDEMSRTFNATIAAFSQAMFVFDGINQGQAILPDGTAKNLGTYENWTKDIPEYVPVGLLPAVAGNKLFLVAPDRLRIFHSVTGRCYDFVVNVDAQGDKGGDASTVATAVSYNVITALKGLSTGQVLVSTLYGTFVLDLDYEHEIFGEPFLRPIFLFPGGVLNDLSTVDILQDTAFITQSGIHAFNAVAQSKRESNNFPLGAPISGLLLNPQVDTCTALFDDYAFFAVNTIHGHGALVYDTVAQQFQSLDLSFGHVKQFATTRFDGSERMFFITHDNRIFEAFSSSKKNSTRVYFGDWTPNDASGECNIDGLSALFHNVYSTGTVKLSIFRDRELHETITIQNNISAPQPAGPLPIPFNSAKRTFDPYWHFHNMCKGFRVGAMIEWDFDGELTDIGLEGKLDLNPSSSQEVQVTAGPGDSLAYFSDSGYPTELNDGGDFPLDGLVFVPVEKHARYVYLSNGNGVLVNGAQQLAQGIFTAAGDHVAVHGVGANTFSLRYAENYIRVLEAIQTNKPIDGILHGGEFAFPAGSLLDVTAAKLPVRLPFYAHGGPVDQTTENGKYFYNKLRVPRFYSKAFRYLDIFFYDCAIDAPNGYDASSVQFAVFHTWVLNSTKPFKLVICNQPAYTSDIINTPGRVDLRIFQNTGVHAVLSAGGRSMERLVVDGFPYFLSGTGGQTLRDFEPHEHSEFRDNTSYGYLHIVADALTCTLSFKNTNNETLDTFALYS